MSPPRNRKRLVIVESPYAGDITVNEAYARACLADSLHRGEAPLASHLLYTQPGVLRDGVPEERSLGIEAGLAWGEVSDATVVYTDRGITEGMRTGIDRALNESRPVEYRTITEATPWPPREVPVRDSSAIVLLLLIIILIIVTLLLFGVGT